MNNAIAYMYEDNCGTHFTEDYNEILDTVGIESWTPLFSLSPVTDDEVDEIGVNYQLHYHVLRNFAKELLNKIGAPHEIT